VNTLSLDAIALAVSFTFSAGAMAQSFSKNDYLAGRDRITAESNLAKARCASLSGNANDICMAEAKGKEKVAIAEFEASGAARRGYQPTSEARYQVRVVRAEADYAVAKERCDDRAGNAKDVCMREAKSAEIAAKADAKAQMRTSDANVDASEKAAKARKEAAAAKLEAEYKVAKEKCDALAGDAKDACLNEAKTRFGK